MLTQDSTGTVLKLTGSTDKLKDHVGHEVQLTGQSMSTASTPSGSDQNNSSTMGGSTSAANAQGFQVTDVKMVSEHCGNGASSSPSGAASGTSVDTTSSSPTATTSTAGAAATSNSTATQGSSQTAATAAPQDSSSSAASASPTTSAATNQSQPPAETAQPQSNQESGVKQYSDMNTTDDTNKNANKQEANALPATASGLPLLALLGVTFVATGLIGGNWRKRRMPNVTEWN
jgi:hypothetical protein